MSEPMSTPLCQHMGRSRIIIRGVATPSRIIILNGGYRQTWSMLGGGGGGCQRYVRRGCTCTAILYVKIGIKGILIATYY